MDTLFLKSESKLFTSLEEQLSFGKLSEVVLKAH